MEEDTEREVMATTPEGVPTPEQMTSSTRPEPASATSSVEMDISEVHDDEAPESPTRLVILRYNTGSEKVRDAILAMRKEVVKQVHTCQSESQMSCQHTQTDPGSVQNSDSFPTSPSEETTSQQTSATAMEKNTAEDETQTKKKPDGQSSEKEFGPKVSLKRLADEKLPENIDGARQLKKVRGEEPPKERIDSEMINMGIIAPQQQINEPILEDVNYRKVTTRSQEDIAGKSHATDQARKDAGSEQKRVRFLETSDDGTLTNINPGQASIKKEPNTLMTEVNLHVYPAHINEQHTQEIPNDDIHVNRAPVEIRAKGTSNSDVVGMVTSDIDEHVKMGQTKETVKQAATGNDSRATIQKRGTSNMPELNVGRHATENNPFDFEARNWPDQFAGFKAAAHESCTKEQIKLDDEELHSRLHSLGKRIVAVNGKWCSKKLTVGLYNAQMAGVSRMKEIEKHGHGGLLADQMGFGKTAQIIALVVLAPAPPNKRKRKTENNETDEESDEDEEDHDDFCPRSPCTLVVGPPRSSKQLLDECNRFIEEDSGVAITPYSRKHVEKGTRQANYQKSDFVITTYGEVAAAYRSLMKTLADHKLAYRDNWRPALKRAKVKIPILFSIKFWRVVLDEAHQIRNPKTIRSQACHALMREKSWCVTATPYVNSTWDLFSQLKFVKDANAQTRNHFKAAYCNADEANPISFEEKFKHLMIRRTSRDKLFGHSVIPKTEMRRFMITIPLSPGERAFIQLIKDIFEDMAEHAKSRKEIINGLPLIRLLRLRQTISSPFMLESFLVKNFSKSKLEVISLRLRELKLELDMLPNISRELRNAGRFSEDSEETLIDTTSPADEGEMDDLLDVSIAFKENTCGICTGRCVEKRSLECGHVFCKSCISSEPTHSGEEILCISCSICKKLCSIVPPEEHNTETKHSSEPSADHEKEDDDKDNYWGSVVEEDAKKKSTIARSKRNKKGGDKPPETRPGYDYRGQHPKLDEHETRWLQEADKAKNMSLLRRGKIGPCADLCQRISKDHPVDKIIAFTQFTQEAAMIGRILQKLSVPFVYLNGQMTRKQTDNALKEMAENAEIRVMITALKCGGESLNCQFANHVILVNPYWNNAVEEQAIGRVARLGQNKTVYVYRLVANNTADDEVSKIQERKKDEAAKLIGEIPSHYFELTRDEVKAALK